MKLVYDLEIEALTAGEADRKALAIQVLAQKLSAKELEVLANIVKNDPVKTALAKRALGL